MLGAVVFGHEQMQIAIKRDQRAGRRSRQAAWDWKPPADRRRSRRAVVPQARERAVRGLPHPRQAAALHASVGAIKAACDRWPLVDGEAPKCTPTTGRRFSCKLENNIVRQRILNGKPRIDGRDLDDRASDHRQGRRAAAHPRLVAVHARRDPGAGRGHARHRARRADHRRARRRAPGTVPVPLQLPSVLGR